MFEKYGAKRELKKRVQGFSPEKKVEYFEKILSKKKMLNPNTRDAAYSLLGDTYLEIGKDQFIKSQGVRNNSNLIEASKAYTKAGEFNRARSIIGTNYPIEKHLLHPLILNKMALGIDREGGTGQEIYNLINKEKKNRRRNNRLEKKVTATTAIIGVVGGLMFLSSNITGNVIGNPGFTGNLIGIILLIAGLIAGFSWLKNK